jgi:hypothetical protein
MNQEHITKMALKLRGWTDKGINLFLKNHDKGTVEAYRIINEKIYFKIAEIYPELKDECDNQLMKKIDESQGDYCY